MMEDSVLKLSVKAQNGSSVFSPVLHTVSVNGPLNLIYKHTTHTGVSEQEEKCTVTDLESVSQGHKSRLIKKFRFIHEAKNKKTLLNQIYTPLYITESENQREPTSKHEMWMMEQEALQMSNFKHHTQINSNDVFQDKSENQENQGNQIRTVLTTGMAGIGKTISVQKFLLDWAEGRANQDVDLVVPMPFRELNLLRDGQYSLYKIIGLINPELKDLDLSVYDKTKVVFILDGLDEFRSPLNFVQHDLIGDIAEPSQVADVIACLIEGRLLADSQIWVTSRPVAASLIPVEFVSRMTEIRGFNESQKEEYFRKRISDQARAKTIVSYVKTIRSLDVMCCVPVFCWIAAEAFQQSGDTQIPTTLTDLYVLFLINNVKNPRSHRDTKKLLEWSREVVLKLSKLAFDQLMKHNVTFYEDDLEDSGISAGEASAFLNEIFREEHVLYQSKVYSFIHLSFQEFLAALYIFHCYVSDDVVPLNLHFQWCFKKHRPGSIQLHEILQAALAKASGHAYLDLFARFLVGISLESNQNLLRGLLRHTRKSLESVRIAMQFIKDELTRKSVSFPDQRAISLFHSLLEMKDQTFHRDILGILRKHSETELSDAQCSIITYLIQTSPEVHQELDTADYSASENGIRNLVPAIHNCRRALLSDSNLDTNSCKTLSLVLQSEEAPLRELDVRNNYLEDSGVTLSTGLKNLRCPLEILRLAGCNLMSEICEALALTLQSVNASLRELDLSNNDLQDSGVKTLSDGLRSPNCKLQTLRLVICNLTEKSCTDLRSVLQTPNSHLRELDLSNNDLRDSGVELLAAGLRSSHCKLEKLGLSGCLITKEGCLSLASALSSNPSSVLKDLDLSYNHPGTSGEKLLSENGNLEKLNVNHGAKIWIKPGLGKYACELTLNLDTAHPQLILSEEKRKITWSCVRNPYPDHPERFNSAVQAISNEGLSERCYFEVEYGGEWKGATMTVTYKSVGRRGEQNECTFGRNQKSWAFLCSTRNCCAYHHNKRSYVPPPQDQDRSRRFGVYLDQPAGTVSFYSVQPEASERTKHLHTYHAQFTEPLYAGLGVWFTNTSNLSVGFCQMKD